MKDISWMGLTLVSLQLAMIEHKHRIVYAVIVMRIHMSRAAKSFNTSSTGRSWVGRGERRWERITCVNHS